MNTSLPKLTLAVLLSLTINLLHAQDIHWAHIHVSPTYLNPAMTGVISNGDLRLIANARSQWNSFTKGYKTVMASADAKIAPAGESGFIGAGINLFADQAGDLDFTTAKAGASFSVVKALDRNGENLVSLGFQVDLLSQSMDYTKMFGFEEETIAFDGTPNNIGYFDLSVGAAWYYQFQWHSSFYVGASYSHITQPDVSFRSKAANNTSDPIPYFRKFLIHGGADLRLGKYVSIVPSGMFVDQGPHQEINGGTFIKFKKDASFSKAKRHFYIGAWLRWYMESDVAGVDAAIFSFRFDHEDTSFTFSYDANISSLRRASHSMGGAEIFIIHVLDFNGALVKGTKVKCPAF